MSGLTIQPNQLSTKFQRQRAPGAPKTYFLQTWGCQMNVEDSEQMELQLESMGFIAASSIIEADIVVLNTCSVRKKPEDKAFSFLGELAILKAKRPELIIGVAGCMAQARAVEIKRRAPHVNFVMGTGDLNQLRNLVEKSIAEQRFSRYIDLPERKGATVETVPQRFLPKQSELKKFVPIQYGCDKFCTFCIVPQTRGRERSRELEDIAAEVEKLVERGTKEVTLLGQTVNSWGKTLPGGKLAFSTLLDRLGTIPGLERIRFTSPYPKDFKPDLMECMRSNPKVMEHCHLPLQSGSDEILNAMHRTYTVAQFSDVADRIRQTIPGVGLTTDIIVGFPGETEEHFQQTLDVVRSIGFDGAYCFAYSPRPGTKAGDMPGQLPEPVKRERLNTLLALQNQISTERNQAIVGEIVEILIEGPSLKNPETNQGFTRDFRMAHFLAPSHRIGNVAKARVISGHQWGVFVELI